MMPRLNVAIAVAVVCILFCGLNCTPQQPDNAQIHDAIVAANKAFMEAFSASDDAALAALYTSDAQLLPGGSDFVTGNEAVQSFWKAIFDAGIKKATLETIEVEGMGEAAFEVGKYALYSAEEQKVDYGKYVVVWKKVNGVWKLHRDIWNTSMPMQNEG